MPLSFVFNSLIKEAQVGLHSNKHNSGFEKRFNALLRISNSAACFQCVGTKASNACGDGPQETDSIIICFISRV